MGMALLGSPGRLSPAPHPAWPSIRLLVIMLASARLWACRLPVALGVVVSTLARSTHYLVALLSIVLDPTLWGRERAGTAKRAAAPHQRRLHSLEVKSAMAASA